LLPHVHRAFNFHVSIRWTCGDWSADFSLQLQVKTCAPITTRSPNIYTSTICGGFSKTLVYSRLQNPEIGKIVAFTSKISYWRFPTSFLIGSERSFLGRTCLY